MNALSAHRTPRRWKNLPRGAGKKVLRSSLPLLHGSSSAGVIASMTTIPVIGVPINASLDGLDALLAIVQMPPGIPVATVGINGALNAAILALQMIATGDEPSRKKLASYKERLKKKIKQANEELASVTYTYKTN